MRRTILVAMSADAHHLRYLEPVWRSLARNTRSRVAVHLLGREMTAADARRLERLAREESISLHVHPTDHLFAGTAAALPRHITRATLDRLWLPEILAGRNRAIYVDTDTLVLGDVAELFAQPTGESGLAAKPLISPGFKTFRRAARSWRAELPERGELGAGDNWRVFNAGVLVLDLVRLRENGLCQRAVEAVLRYGWNDNLALSWAVRDGFSHLPAEWNVFVGQDHAAIAGPRLVHWIGERKPWNAEVPLGDLWKAYAQPPAPQSGLALRAAGRARHSSARRKPRA